eukprot:scaffold2816_cov121-Cylindrotheca_fusiformis.AAC.7
MKLCLLLFALLAPAVTSSLDGTIVSPIVDYSFSCGSDGQSKVQSHSSLLDSLVGVNSTRCNYVSNGVASSNTIIESSSTIATMRNHFLKTNAPGLVVELWITPTAISSRTIPRPIFTIGGQHKENDDDDYDKVYGCYNEELYVGMRGDLLEVRYVDNDPRLSCRVLMVRQQPLNNELTQVVLALFRGETSVYINGKPIIVGAPNSFMTNLTAWNPESTLQLLSNHFSTQAFAGTLHQVSIYDQFLTDIQIGTVYQQKLLDQEDSISEREPLHLVALEEPSTIIQGEASSVSVGGLNRSTDEYLIQVEIMSLPTYGSILGDQGPIRDTGVLIPLNGSWKTTSLFYRSWSDDLFTTPQFSYSGKDLHLSPEAFEYRLVAIDRSNGALLGLSSIVRKEIFIRHVNQAPALVVPRIATIAADQPTGIGARPIAEIEGALLDDPDRNVDRVRVDIWTHNGTIAMRNYHQLADFNPRATRSQLSWQCHGSPEGSRNMTFLAEPDSVTLILSSLRYEGFHWNQEDSIVIRIYDGSEGPCLEEDEHKFNSIHDGCYEIVATLSVPPIAQPKADFDIRDVSMLEVSFWLLCLIPLMALCCIIQCCCKFKNVFCNRSVGGGVTMETTDEEQGGNGDDSNPGDVETPQ